MGYRVLGVSGIAVCVAVSQEGRTHLGLGRTMTMGTTGLLSMQWRLLSNTERQFEGVIESLRPADYECEGGRL